MARRQILTLLIEYQNHASADELLTALRRKGHKASPATLYQNLANLVEAGLLKRFTGADGLVRYDSNLMPHHHLICIRCGKVEDALIGRTGKDAVRPLVLETGKPPAGWKLDGLMLEFKGVCPDCLKKR
jgi:Fe2+ or Zn2+ uptake regulation protein